MIEVLVFTQNGCRYCGPVKLFLSEKETELTNAKLTYINLSELSDDERETYKTKYKLMAAPTLVFERNGIEMARSTGIGSIDEFDDCLEYAITAK